MFANFTVTFLLFAVPLLISVTYFTLVGRKILSMSKSKSILSFMSFHPNTAFIPLLLTVVGISAHLVFRKIIIKNPITWQKIYLHPQKGLLFLQLFGLFVTVVIFAGLLLALACFILNIPILVPIHFLVKLILGLWTNITPAGLFLKFVIFFEGFQQIPYLGVIVESLISIFIDICVLSPQNQPYLDLFEAVRGLITILVDWVLGPLTPISPEGELPPVDLESNSEDSVSTEGSSESNSEDSVSTEGSSESNSDNFDGEAKSDS